MTLAMMIPVMALNLIPVIGSVASAVCGYLVTVCMMSVQAMDPPMSRRRYKFTEKLSLIRTQPFVMAGFGTAVWFLFWVPGINLLMIPFACTGGALLHARLKNEGSIRFEDRRVLKDQPANAAS